MLLTKTQKRILELVREYGGMKAEMLERLCGGSHRFDVVLRQLEMNRMLFKMGEYYCDDSKNICGRDTETAFEVMLAIADSPPEIYCRGQPPFELTFFKDRKDKLYRYDVCIVNAGREIVINAMLQGMKNKIGIPVFVTERIEQTELLTVPPDCRFAVKQNNKYIFYGGS